MTHAVLNDSSDTPQAVQEYVDSAGQTLRSEATRGVLRGVKLLGLRSRNGRRYAEKALRDAIGLYEGSKVNVNHPTRDPLAPRDYRDRLGVVRNVRYTRGDGLFGDLHYNPRHALAEQLAWDAEHAPENVGLSHNVMARTRREADELVVEAITRVQSVDLVADPATTGGLFEACRDPDTAPQSEDEPRPETLVEENYQLREELNQLRDQLERQHRRRRIDQLVEEHGLEEEAVQAVLTEGFVRLLMEAGEDDLAPLIEDRVCLVKRPISAPHLACREQSVVADETPTTDTAQFVAALSRRG
ncbi:hypothetical protein MalM25_34280 [Planctomycetes bacterium MalM25]|nr:hypothetical protein MalM25_34280 [Planctomycetes bacterium MalM25]